MSERAKWQREMGIFTSFLEVRPDFAGALITGWDHNKNAAPDIICTDARGRRIGVELTEWLHEEQISAYARWQGILTSVPVPAGWFVEVHMNAAYTQDCEKADRRPFIAELSALLPGAVSQPKVYDSGLETFALDSFALVGPSPTVAKYCSVVAGHKLGSTRIILLAGGSFSPLDAEGALQAAITRKTCDPCYELIKPALGLSLLFLVVYYDQAMLKNTPNLEVDPQVVGAPAMGAWPGGFDGGFVLMHPDPMNGPRRQVCRIYPL